MSSLPSIPSSFAISSTCDSSQHKSATPGAHLDLPRTCSNASLVSIWTIVRRLSLAAFMYSNPLRRPWFSNAPGLKGLPKPRLPFGGNLDACTSFFASSTSYTNGTTMPWAPASSARLTIHSSFAAIRTRGEAPVEAMA